MNATIAGTAIDPVDAPDAYRAELLRWLDADDPALVQSVTAEAMRRLVRDAGDRLRIRPAPGEWSVIECLGHLVDSELTTSARVRWIVAEDEPDIVGYDQALWVSRLGQDAEDPEQLLAVFEAIRRWNLDLWARTPASERGRVGIHRERGPESYELTFRLAAGHDRIHLAQARRALEAARGQATKA